jgi:hypothetical protein
MTDLGIKDGGAFGINSKTQVVGVQKMGEERHPHSIGFLWEKAAFYDLNRRLSKDSPYHIQGTPGEWGQQRIVWAVENSNPGVLPDQLPTGPAGSGSLPVQLAQPQKSAVDTYTGASIWRCRRSRKSNSTRLVVRRAALW